MRNYYISIIILFYSLLIMYCSEENPTESIDNKYHGTWLWYKTVGGIATRVSTPKEGITIKISYDKKGIFRKFRNDSLKVLARYKVEESKHNKDKISYSDVITNDFYFNTDSEYSQIRTDTLELWDGMFDGYFSFYKKIN